MTVTRVAEIGGTDAPLAVGKAVRATIAAAADQVDKRSAFPADSVSVLSHAGLLHAALSADYGGPGTRTADLAGIARVLGRACGSTAMIWSMHQVQLACVQRHRGSSELLGQLLDDCVTGDRLIASVTSERGVGGDLRTSRAWCEWNGTSVTLTKDAPTISYCREAGAYLITARRGETAAPGDQVAVFATREQAALADVSGWNVMGMRGTQSPGCQIRIDVPAEQVLPDPFGLIAARTMVPLSHILWSAVWIGIAEEAIARATTRLRAGLADAPARNPGDPRLADAALRLSLLDGLLGAVIDGYDKLGADGPTADFAVEVNNLKVAASVQTVRAAEAALEICGMAGYSEDGPLSISRLLRDLYSARLMVANSRLAAANATTLLLRHYG